MGLGWIGDRLFGCPISLHVYVFGRRTQAKQTGLDSLRASWKKKATEKAGIMQAGVCKHGLHWDLGM